MSSMPDSRWKVTEWGSNSRPRFQLPQIDGIDPFAHGQCLEVVVSLNTRIPEKPHDQREGWGEDGGTGDGGGDCGDREG